MEVAAPLIQKVSPLPVPPFLFSNELYDRLAEAPSHDTPVAQPLPSWTFARKRPTGEKLPQTIAHRGYKAKHPENTMGAFQGAVKAGAHAIETDIHLTKDEVVVLSHDANLKRCFGKEEKIIDCTYEYISQQRTLATPHEPMPRLQDLLQFLATPGTENMWVLLDIKLDNDADDVMRLIAKTIASVAPNPLKPWNQRIVLGCWAAKFIPLCAKYLPTFAITHIGFSLAYARQFLSVPNVSFNVLQQSLLAPYFGARFLRDAKAKGRPVFDWTVNEVPMMRWSISKGLDGVITDDPKKFLEVCDDWEQGKREIKFPWKSMTMIAWINFMVMIFGSIFWWKHGRMDRQQMKKKKLRQAMSFSGRQDRGKR
ncbi:hypothetical protein JMJ35_002160 [Cladonia borealis]|uniref:GP-PDE domain-containing protein n=1 Tax=Cladonia borealis TaxID=184061 RepID=A0AA39R9U9_9LECA|nr:hypothetical protein JMJ35_002160 [Cladonia borealis]